MGLNVIMMGPPGAGKGTQAGRIARERGLLKISTGDILRDAVQSGSEMGVAAKIVMDAGRRSDRWTATRRRTMSRRISPRRWHR